MRTCPGAPFCSSSRGQPCLTGAITPAQSGSLAPGSATRPYPPPPMWPSLAPPPVVHVVATSGPYRSTGEPLSLMCWLDTSAYGGVRGTKMASSWGGHSRSWLSCMSRWLMGKSTQFEVHNTLGKSTSLPFIITVVYGSDWYQLSPGPMAGFGAGVPLLFLLSNLRV
ncbi:unnamed protein product [Caretta caretta]